VLTPNIITLFINTARARYHHVGHPTTPWEAQEGGLMEFWAGHTAFLLGARTGERARHDGSFHDKNHSSD
jgi:hypothetical protein